MNHKLIIIYISIYISMDINMYKNKYLKYKTKYLDLQKQFGGECDPVPNFENEDEKNDYILEPLEGPADQRMTFDGQCYKDISIVQSINFNGEIPHSRREITLPEWNTLNNFYTSRKNEDKNEDEDEKNEDEDKFIHLKLPKHLKKKVKNLCTPADNKSQQKIMKECLINAFEVSEFNKCRKIIVEELSVYDVLPLINLRSHQQKYKKIIDNAIIRIDTDCNHKETLKDGKQFVERYITILTRLNTPAVFLQNKEDINVLSRNIEQLDNIISIRSSTIVKKHFKIFSKNLLEKYGFFNIIILYYLIQDDASITHLNLSEQNISDFVPTTLMESITHLNLSEKNISYLVSTTFTGLVLLQTLNLSNNNLSNIESDTFAGVRSLQTLILSNTKLSNIKLGTFAGLTSLQELNLSANNLSNFAPGTFLGLTSLQELNLSNNNLSNIDMATFDRLPLLQTLNLSNNNLSNIESDTFAGFRTLQTLNLSNTKLYDIKLGTFAELRTLQELNLSNTKLYDIKSGTFAELTSLQKLNLSNNNLSNIEPSIFAELTSLQELNLANNNLFEIKSGTFAGLTSLQELNLSNNNLSNIELGPLPPNIHVIQ